MSVWSKNFVQTVGERSDVKSRRERLFLRRGGRQRRMRRSQRKLFVALDKAFETEIIGGDLTQRFQLFALLRVQKGKVTRDSNYVVLIRANELNDCDLGNLIFFLIFYLLSCFIFFFLSYFFVTKRLPEEPLFKCVIPSVRNVFQATKRYLYLTNLLW